MASGGNGSVNLGDSGYIKLSGRNNWSDDESRKLRNLKLELNNAKRELKETIAKWHKDNATSRRQVSQLTKKNLQLKLDLQSSIEEKEQAKIQMNQMNDTLLAKDIDLEDARNRIKRLEKLLKDYEMAVRKSAENNPLVRSSTEYNERIKDCIDSKEEFKRCNELINELGPLLVETIDAKLTEKMEKVEATHIRVETIDAKVNQMMAMMQTLITANDHVRRRHDCIPSMEDTSSEMA
ncbi:uncharacterized protein LOC127880007 [Dreissena polymorpha]|uniref:Uncharacterized protein n=1 Tax=Dreissena polymorpha TaxID=45954 RepID=A0A9D4QQ81_DREPO|nr:uncharacterized protein LOC127880007 [Dreissena polymorpha]KAH3839521.1 hypothetical protein DPMN_112952 [Dreissena polymorpha]